MQFLPLIHKSVPAGFPSPADDYIERGIDLNQYLVQHPASTFFMRVSGLSMRDAGIHHGDLLIVDKSINPRPGSIVVAVLDGSFTLKKITFKNGFLYLEAENPDYQPIKISHCHNLQIWGVATYSIHNLKLDAKGYK